MDKDQQATTSDMAAGQEAWLMSNLASLFAQLVSEENSRCSTRAMHANAASGFYNGGTPVFGYCTVTAEVQGTRARKKLEVNPDEARVVQQIFNLAQHGDNGKQLDPRAIAALLNQASCSLRGARFTKASVARVLSRTHYVGYYLHAATSPTDGESGQTDRLRVACPPIVTPEQFAIVGELL